MDSAARRQSVNAEQPGSCRRFRAVVRFGCRVMHTRLGACPVLSSLITVGAFVQRVNEYRFYELGAALQQLKDLTDKTLLWDAFLPCLAARDALMWLLIDHVSLRVCRPTVEMLLSALKAILPRRGESTNPNAPIGYKAERITSGVTELSTLLAAECPTLDTYAVSQKGAYSMPILIDQAEMLLPADTRQRLDDVAIQDIRQAGRCLAFDLPTAAGFHLFRAVESVMRHLHNKLKGTSQEPERLPGWAAYVKALKDAPVPSDVTDMLDSIREHYRNPLAHPDATLTTDEAIVLVPLGVAAICKMADLMPADGQKESRQDEALAKILAAPSPNLP